MFDQEFAAELDQNLSDGTLRLEEQLLKRERLDTLLGWPRLAEVRVLELVSSSISLTNLTALLEEPALASLEALRLADTIDERAGAELIGVLAAVELPALRQLSLECMTPRLDASGVRALLALPFLRQLEMLELSASVAGSPSSVEERPPIEAFAALCAHEGPFVRRLGLRHVVGDQEAKALAGAPWFSKLRHLDASGGHLYAFGLYTLFGAISSSEIESLDLSENWLHSSNVNPSLVVEAKMVWDDMRPSLSKVRIKEPSWSQFM